jgi:hypothetical protein
MIDVREDGRLYELGGGERGAEIEVGKIERAKESIG